MNASIQSRVIAGLGLLGAAVAVSCAQADVIYSNPGLHVITGAVQDSVVIQRDAQVAITGHGVVMGRGSTAQGRNQGAIQVNGGELTLQDRARLVAGGSRYALNQNSTRSSVQLRGNAIVDGAIHAAGTRDNWQSEQSAGQRLRLQDNAVVNGNVTYSGHLRIQDNARIAGQVSNSDGGNVAIAISGGSLDGGVYLNGSNQHSVDMSGGLIRGAFSGGTSSIDLNMSGGRMTQGIRSNGVMQADFSGGRVDRGIAIDTQLPGGVSNLLFTGGAYDALANHWLLSLDNREYTAEASSLEIWGGEFGYQQSGRGIFLDQHVDFAIHGNDLIFANGWLTGFLSDGSWFNQAFTFGNNWQGRFEINNLNVPEPGTLALLLMGVAGCAVAGRRRARTAAAV